MAVASVTTNIVIKGQDQASDAINKAGKSAKGLTGALEAAQSKANGLVGSLRSLASGDVGGGLGGLKGSLGGGPGLAGQAALAAAGVAGVAAAIGVAAVKATEWSIELERLRAQMRFAFGPEGEQAAFAMAEAIGGVAVESVVKLQTTLKAADVDAKLTVEQLQAITNAATAMGKTGDDALTAFADAIRSGSADALKQVGVFVNGEVAIKKYAESLGLSAERLTAQQRSQAVLNATLAQIPGLAQAGTDAYAKQDAALARLSNATTRWKLELSELIAGPALQIIKDMEELSSGFVNLEKVGKAALKALTAPLRGLASGFQRAARAAVLLKRGDFGEALLAAGESLAKVGTLGTAQILDDVAGAMSSVGERSKSVEEQTNATTKALESHSASVGGLSYAYDIFSAGAKEAAEAQIKFSKAAKEEEKRAAKARADAAARAAKAMGLKISGQDADFMKGLAADRKKDQERANELKRQEAESTAARILNLQQYRDRVLAAQQEIATDPSVRAQIEQQRIQLDLKRQIAEVSEQYAMDEQLRQQAVAAVTLEANARMDASAKALADAEAAAAAKRTEQAYGVAGAIIKGIGMIEGAERAQAGLQALIETARSISSFASYDFAAGAQHAVSAAMYAKAALTPAPTPSAATPSAPAMPTPQASGNAGQLTININAGAGIIGTAAEVGLMAQKAVMAAMATGKPMGSYG